LEATSPVKYDRPGSSDGDSYNSQAFIIQKRLTYLAEFIEDNYEDKQPKVILITNKKDKKLERIIENLNDEYSNKFLNLVALP